MSRKAQGQHDWRETGNAENVSRRGGRSRQGSDYIRPYTQDKGFEFCLDSDRKPMESVLNGEINYLLIQKITLDAVQRIDWGKIEN